MTDDDKSLALLAALPDYDRQLLSKALCIYGIKLMEVLIDEASDPVSFSDRVTACQVVLDEMTRARELMEALC